MRRNILNRGYFISVLLGLIAVMVLGGGCHGGNDLRNQAASNSGIVKPGETVSAGQAITLSIADRSAVSASWTFLSRTSGAVIDPLQRWQDSNQLAGVVTFTDSGIVDIKATEKTAAGTVRNLQDSIIVVMPGPAVKQDLLTAATLQGGTIVASVSNDNTSSGIPQVMMNLPVQFDLRGSKTSGPVDFSIDFGDQTNATLTKGNFVAQHTYSKPGQYTVRIQSSGDGATSVVNILMQVKCDASVPPLQVKGISVTQTTENLHYYLASVSGGSGKYGTLWMPDGTGVWRTPGGQGLMASLFADYVGNRSVSVIVNDVSCGNQITYTQSHDFTIPTSDGVPGNGQGSQVGDLPFLQGLLSSQSDSSDPRLNAFLAIFQDGKDPGVRRVTGQYHPLAGDGGTTFPGSFTESAINPINPADPNNQDGITVNAIFDAGGNMSIQSVTVYAAGNADSGNPVMDSYTSTSCTANGSLKTMMGKDPCNSKGPGSPEILTGYLVDYTYSCPVLTDSAGRTISLKKGAGYYISQLNVDNCGGGGGGGGGGAPSPAF